MRNISMVHWAHKLTFSLPLQTLKFIIPPSNLFLYNADCWYMQRSLSGSPYVAYQLLQLNQVNQANVFTSHQTAP